MIYNIFVIDSKDNITNLGRVEKLEDINLSELLRYECLM